MRAAWTVTLEVSPRRPFLAASATRPPGGTGTVGSARPAAPRSTPHASGCGLPCRQSRRPRPGVSCRAMARINEHYRKLAAGYLFPEIGRRVRAFQQAHPDAQVIRLGIGDVTLPLVPAVVEAMHAAVDEMGTPQGFRGYGPEQGYDFLVDAIREHDYARARRRDRRATRSSSPTAASATAATSRRSSAATARIAVTDPVYPVYVDTNVMAGRTGAADGAGRYAGILYLPANEANGFVPGAAAASASTSSTCARRTTRPARSRRARSSSAGWRGRARTTPCSSSTPPTRRTSRSRAARARSTRSTARASARSRCAASRKRAGFTGRALRLHGGAEGASRARPPRASACRCTSSGRAASHQVQRRVLRGAARGRGGRTRPRAASRPASRSRSTWRTRAACARASRPPASPSSAACTRPTSGCARRAALSSWEFFDRLLGEAHVVGTPGAGFGPAGEGYFRLSAFNSRANVEEAIARIRRAFGRA